MDIQQTPFIRELASSDRHTRDKALDSLTLFLRSRRDLELVELLKVWKGLFFCFYHSDRPLTQQSLARSLSYTLLPTLHGPTLQPFLRAFWITMSRDFHSLDRLRLDKYLYLLRCYIGAAFEIFLNMGLARAQKETETKGHKDRETENGGASKKRKREDKEGKESSTWSGLDTYLSMLEEGPLCPYNFDPKEPNTKNEVNMPKGPDGIRYHIMDIWLDEIEKCATETESVFTADGQGGDADEEDNEGENEDGEGGATTTTLKPGIPMELLLRPISQMQEKSPNKIVRRRATEVLEDERLVTWGVREPKEEDDEEDDEWGGFD